MVTSQTAYPFWDTLVETVRNLIAGSGQEFEGLDEEETVIANPANGVIMVRATGAQHEEVQRYLDEMSILEAEYPSVRFVYMTGFLDGSGETGNLHARNEQIRAHVAGSDRVLFDYADIESFDPSGNAFLALFANDACDYTGGNWADQWCTANPGSPLCVATNCPCATPGIASTTITARTAVLYSMSFGSPLLLRQLRTRIWRRSSGDDMGIRVAASAVI